uniref:Uncharacterized protein n=1 Tax=Hyaloperonospora arabidopsidis (strain Emoy2) TaxID=559515 RepID=M4C607_HYAAE
MVDRGDFVGSVAGKVQDQYAKPSSGLTDGRKEKRIAKVAADTGATFETARNIVESDADNGAIPMIGNQQPDREIVDYAKDAVRSVAKIAPTTAKFATDVAGMVTYPIPIVSDMIMTAGDAMQSAIDYQTSQQSPELRAKTAEMQRIIQKAQLQIWQTSFLKTNLYWPMWLSRHLGLCWPAAVSVVRG